MKKQGKIFIALGILALLLTMLSGGWDSIRFVISLVFNLVYIVDIFPEFDFWGIIGNWYWNPYVQTGCLCVSLLFRIALELLMLLAIWITTNAYKPHLKIVKISALLTFGLSVLSKCVVLILHIIWNLEEYNRLSNILSGVFGDVVLFSWSVLLIWMMFVDKSKLRKFLWAMMALVMLFEVGLDVVCILLDVFQDYHWEVNMVSQGLFLTARWLYGGLLTVLCFALVFSFRKPKVESKPNKISLDMQSLLDKAILIAEKAHAGATDKTGKPYIGHVIRVMNAGKTIDEKIVGVLHDLVEDTDWTFDMLLAEGFPIYIVDALRCVTKISEDEPYDQFIERVKTNPLAVAVKINDLSDNMDIRRLYVLTDNDVQRLRKYLQAYQSLTR